MIFPNRNYRPPLRTRIRLRGGLFWDKINPDKPTLLTVLIVFLCLCTFYMIADYITMYGDMQATKAENAKLEGRKKISKADFCNFPLGVTDTEDRIEVRWCNPKTAIYYKRDRHKVQKGVIP